MYTDTGGYLSLFRGLSLDSVDSEPQQEVQIQVASVRVHAPPRARSPNWEGGARGGT